MATRTHTKWKLDSQGQYARQIGWKKSGDGGYIQHKFRLGGDLQAARLRELRLQEFWRHIEEATDRPHDKATWAPHTLDIAKQIAKGQTQIVLKRFPKDNEQSYARWLHRVQRHYPMLSIVADDPQAYQHGKQINHDFATGQIDEVRNRHLRVGNLTKLEILADACGALHQAFDAYLLHIKQTVIDVANPKPSGQTRCNCVLRLKQRHADTPLARINLDRIQEMLDYWRNRPKVKNKEKHIARKTAIHHVAELVRFFKWLHKSDQFRWRKPEDFGELDRKVGWTKEEMQARETAEQVATWTVEQLCTLYTYATPIERIVLLFGLNCGFGAAEQGTVLMRQIFFDHTHPRAKRFRLEGPGNFVKRIRLKNGVYGEHLLWPHTVQGLRWLSDKRLGHSNIKPDSLLFANAKGNPYWTPMGRGTQRFGKIWSELLDRVQRDKPKFPRLSFGKLRKTSGDLIREFSSGEIAKIHWCHGKPVAGDELSEVYSNKPFGKLFRAMGKVENYLAPMFAAVAEPFAEHRKSYLGLSKSQRILELYDAGTSLSQIVAELAIAPSTIYRTLEANGRPTQRKAKQPK